MNVESIFLHHLHRRHPFIKKELIIGCQLGSYTGSKVPIYQDGADKPGLWGQESREYISEKQESVNTTISAFSMSMHTQTHN